MLAGMDVDVSHLAIEVSSITIISLLDPPTSTTDEPFTSAEPKNSTITTESTTEKSTFSTATTRTTSKSIPTTATTPIGASVQLMLSNGMILMTIVAFVYSCVFPTY